MTQEQATPPGFWERIEQMIERKVAGLARAGMLRNASITDGGLTVKGGFFRLLSDAINGVEQFYLGPVGDVMGNGKFQQWFRLKRADGSTVLRLWDAFPGVDGTLNQALSWLDRGGNAVFADDTDSGQGIARPYVPGVFYRARNSDWPSMTGGTFVTMYRAKMPKQQPKLYVEVWAHAPDAGAVAEVQILVNGAAFDVAKQSATGFVSQLNFGPLTVSGTHMSTLTVEIQARLASGTGVVQVAPARLEGRQT